MDDPESYDVGKTTALAYNKINGSGSTDHSERAGRNSGSALMSLQQGSIVWAVPPDSCSYKDAGRYTSQVSMDLTRQCLAAPSDGINL